MGGIFNTPGTMTVIGLLSQTFTLNFSTTAQNPLLIADLNPNSGMSSYDFCVKYGLVASGKGANSINSHWQTWLDYFDASGGDQIRTAMVRALTHTNKYEAIEFFAYPSANFKVSSPDNKNLKTGYYSLIVTAETPTYDQL